MSIKNYVLIAAAIRQAIEQTDLSPDAICVAYRIADALGAENPLFDRRKFLTAADPTYGAPQS
jgi:hypothetical protein